MSCPVALCGKSAWSRGAVELTNLRTAARRAVDIAVAEVEFMGEIVGATVGFGNDDIEPILGLTALASVGIEIDPVSQRLKRRPSVRMKGRAAQSSDQQWLVAQCPRRSSTQAVALRHPLGNVVAGNHSSGSTSALTKSFQSASRGVASRDSPGRSGTVCRASSLT